MRRTGCLRVALAAGLLFAVGAAMAQTSAGYRLEEYVLNAGGNPAGGVILSSPGTRVTLDALGESVVGRGLSSASYRLDLGFVPPFRPPGEVLGLVVLADDRTLAWSPEGSVGVYHLYRGLLSALSPSNSGSCQQWDLHDESTIDDDPVPTGDGHFYLVTAVNRLDEEGTRGVRSPGGERPDTPPCP